MAAAQLPARIVLNSNPFVVMNNAVNIVLDNENNNGITETNGGGMIVSENEDSDLIWHVNQQTGQTYTVPFGTKPVLQGGNGVKIPVVVAITTAGSQNTSGSITFSTWETLNDDNTSLPVGVTNASDGLKAVDRFWEVIPTDYSANPEVYMSFTYDDNANEIGGSNTLVETNLVAQNYNTTTDLWLTTSGTVNATANVVSGIVLNATQFGSATGLWALVDFSSPLPVKLTSFEASCAGTVKELAWSTATEINNDYFIVEKSFDAIHFFDLATYTGAGNSNVIVSYLHTDVEVNNQRVYYRLKQVDFNGDFEYSYTITVFPCSDGASIAVYPNPFKDVLNIAFPESNGEAYSIEIVDYLGRIILQENANSDNGVHTIKMDEIHSKGVYFVKIKTGVQQIVKKLIKN
tara:strand:- start:485 stop:1699 length:1215 start_codon:yes stop_codon:yes gene_type:complete